MPSPIQNDWTLRKLIQNTYHHMRNRYTYKERDVLKRVTVKKILVYGNKPLGKARTTFRIETSSYPQYSPYFTRRDSRGRLRQRQRTYKHQYDVVISLDKLSLDVPVKIRTGADKKWDFGPSGKTTKDSRGRIIEGTNIKRGINGDHFFRLSYIRKQENLLFGRNYSNGPPKITNTKQIQFLTKHELRAVEYLVNAGVIQ